LNTTSSETKASVDSELSPCQLRGELTRNGNTYASAVCHNTYASAVCHAFRNVVRTTAYQVVACSFVFSAWMKVGPAVGSYLGTGGRGSGSVVFVLIAAWASCDCECESAMFLTGTVRNVRAERHYKIIRKLFR
jgi:hypothetical protein